MTNINIISFFIGKILKKFPFFKETFAVLLFIYYQGFSTCIRLVGRFSFTKLAFPVLQFGEWAAAGLQEHRSFLTRSGSSTSTLVPNESTSCLKSQSGVRKYLKTVYSGVSSIIS